MIPRVILIIICLCVSWVSVEAKSKGPKWIYHVVTEGQTVEQIVRGYSVLYDVDLKRFLKWNNYKQWDVPKQGDIFMIANKPSKAVLAAKKEEKKKKKKKKRPQKKKKKKKTKPNKQIEIGDEAMIAAIKFAGNETGVRHAFLAGMLHIETRFGSHVGSCNYKKSKMGPPEQLLFEEICEELGYDPAAMKVSCPQKGQRGGGMGVAQFIPSTWKVYQSRVGKVVGKKIPDPWDAKDATVAMALKVVDDSPGVKEHKKRAEMNAAKMYLSGTTLNKYNGHARKVLAAAKKFEDQF